MSSQKYYYYWRPIGDWHALSETSTFFIGDLDMLHRIPTCLIGDPLKTSTCFIGDRHAWLETHRRHRHAKSETNMSDWRPIEDRHAPSVSNGSPMKHIEFSDGSPIRHIGIWWSLSRSSIMHVGLRWVSDGSPIVIIFSWTLKWGRKLSAHTYLKSAIVCCYGMYVKIRWLFVVIIV